MSVTAAARARAEARALTDACTITRATSGGEWTPEGGLPTATTDVHEAPCLLTAARDRRYDTAGGDQRVRFTHTLALPTSATGIAIGDEVAVESQSEVTYTVTALDERTNRVLQRLGLVASRDAEGVTP